MTNPAWKDLRADARAFARQNPTAAHTLVFVPDRSAEGVRAIDVEAGGPDDFAAMLARASDTDGPLRELGVGGINSRLCQRTQRALSNGDGFVAEWLWSDPVGGTIHPNEEAGEAWPRLCNTLWQLVVDRVDTIVPVALAAGDVDAPTIGKEPKTSDAARLLHWLAWSGQVEGLRANVGWRLLFRPTDDSQLPEFATFPKSLTQSSPFDAGRPERPAPIPDKPWLHVAGWWWSTIERAGEALVAVIDWLFSGLSSPEARLAGSEAQHRPADPTSHPTARDLSEVAGISTDTFRRVRTAAGIEVQAKGGAARNRRYSPDEVDRLIAAARSGNFHEREAMQRKWAQWSTERRN